jgi:hypothetical protein
VASGPIDLDGREDASAVEVRLLGIVKIDLSVVACEDREVPDGLTNVVVVELA